MEEEPEDISTTKDVLKAGDVYSRALKRQELCLCNTPTCLLNDVKRSANQMSFAIWRYLLFSLHGLWGTQWLYHISYSIEETKQCTKRLLPISNTINVPEDLYRRPVVVAAVSVFSSSSTPLPHDRRTPNPEYMTANTPNVLAVAAPCFITWFSSLKKNVNLKLRFDDIALKTIQ
uniref:Uncharacterized protein n=1 Tax=Timema cristinae TaxID=61476 RepID=A0A7R9CM77_TIMCR|nr:unnamed protein product [Timema cristinae]